MQIPHKEAEIIIEKEKISYRRADINDVDILVDLRVRFLNSLYNHTEDKETKILKVSLKDYFTKAIASGNFIAWLAEYNGETIGTSGMVLWELPGRYGGLESGRLGYILNMYTVPEVRRKGVCTRLLEELIKEAKSFGIKYLHLHASKDGMNIYWKTGFAEPDQPELVLKL